MENERTGLAYQHAEALETLAADAAAQGDSPSAAQWWRRLAEQDPLSSRVTVHLMSALAAAGNRAAALEQAREYEALIRDELGAAPNPAITALAAQLRRRPQESEGKQPGGRSVTVAVLPFTNLSSSEGNEFFAEGLGDELAAALGRLQGVRVTARSSVQVFRGPEGDAREIGRRLGVVALIEGTVRQAGNRIRLSIQLVDAGDGCQLWSERFERELSDIFATQDELTAAILRGIEAPLRSLASDRG